MFYVFYFLNISINISINININTGPVDRAGTGRVGPGRGPGRAGPGGRRPGVGPGRAGPGRVAGGLFVLHVTRRQADGARHLYMAAR